ncbi:MAG: hypothetical protein OXE40_08720, partial [Gammaproteobacteria bacterium]|nr:hypothetical protein [Gammaproteobacteria bacterium]
VDAVTGIISTVAGTGAYGPGGDGGPAKGAEFSWPLGVAVDVYGNLYIADSNSNRVRRVDALGGVITTIAGTGAAGFGGDGGPATDARLSFPRSMAVDAIGNLFVADAFNDRIRRVNAATGIITTVAGTGGGINRDDGIPAVEKAIGIPADVTVSAAGDLHIAVLGFDRILRIGAVDGIITTVVGTGATGFGGDSGSALNAVLNRPEGVAVSSTGDIYVADTRNHRVRAVSGNTGVITTIAGTGAAGFGGDGGPSWDALLNMPSDVELDAAGDLYVADTENHRIRKLTRGRSAVVPYFPAASDEFGRQGFVRVVNRSRRAGIVRIEAVDDTGDRRGPLTLSIGARETVHFNSDHLEARSTRMGLVGNAGTGQGAWRLELSSDLNIKVLAYVRTRDGFLTSMHDVAQNGGAEWRVPIFNPASNENQRSLLRMTNPSAEDADVTITGIDDSGASPGTAVRLQIPARSSRTLTASELESGTASEIEGALGDGSGKWRLIVESPQSILVMSLLSSPTGHLTNLSTVSTGLDRGESGSVVPMFPSASARFGRQGFVRVVNRSTMAGDIRIDAYDDSERTYDPLTLSIDGGETKHFNSNDLELGNAEIGLSGNTGAGTGDWWLVLSSELDIHVLAYIRTRDGFLTSMHDTAPATLGMHRVATYNPGSNSNQQSVLRLVNPGDEDARVTITGVDDSGAVPGTSVRLTVSARTSRMIRAETLETGGAGFDGALGDGAGKWQLVVASHDPLVVTSLLSSPTGHLTNLSSQSREDPGADDLYVSD